jgi:hypothetical protein
VGGSPAHAVIHTVKIVGHDIGAPSYHRVGSRAHPTNQPVICVIMSPTRFQKSSGTYSSTSVIVR